MNLEHASWLREGVDAWNRRRKKINFSPSLAAVNFFEYLPPDFRDSPKTSRYFERIDLSGADLRGSDLSSLNFSGAKFKGADLNEANLSRSNFDFADFTNANLSNADVVNSHFHSTKFDRANLTDVDLEVATLTNARFSASSLSDRQLATVLDRAASIIETIAGVQIRRTDQQSVNQPKKAHEKKPKNQYDVFFATNRDPILTRGKLENFGAKRLETLSYGICEVIIPDGHRIGQLGTSLWKKLLNLKDDTLRRESLISLSDELFWKFLSDTASKMTQKNTPTVFVHGFNTSFDDAVLRTAQLGFDLGIGQGIGLFSWPSKGDFRSYLADEANAEASKYVLADFIAEFVKKTPDKKVNLIAHSMGCKCLVGALETLSNGRTSVLNRVEQVILSAADVDSQIMPYQGKHIIGRCKRVTSYVSKDDFALKISGWLRSVSRVGFTPPTFVLEGMDTVMVNDANLGDFSHGYFASSRDVIKDVFDILQKNAAPHLRHSLVREIEGEAVFWRMRD